VVETCAEGNPYQVVTHVEINGAHESDHAATVPIVKQLADKGLSPEKLYADTAFGSGENLVECAKLGVELAAPVHDPAAPERKDPRWETETAPVDAPSLAAETPKGDEPGVASELPPAEADSDPSGAGACPGTACGTEVKPETGQESHQMGLESFRFNRRFDEVSQCPAGAAPAQSEKTGRKKTNKAIFSAKDCRSCPLAGRCPTRRNPRTGERTLKWRSKHAATATRQREQQESAFRKDYKIRSGIESTMEEFKDRHGGKRPRVRGRDRVELASTLKLMALNVKRAVQYHVDQLLGSFDPAPTEGFALAPA
jgi:hypothetical protein